MQVLKKKEQMVHDGIVLVGDPPQRAAGLLVAAICAFIAYGRFVLKPIQARQYKEWTIIKRSYHKNKVKSYSKR